MAVTRFCLSTDNGYLHSGHYLNLLVNKWFAENTDGKFFVLEEYCTLDSTPHQTWWEGMEPALRYRWDKQISLTDLLGSEALFDGEHQGLHGQPPIMSSSLFQFDTSILYECLQIKYPETTWNRLSWPQKKFISCYIDALMGTTHFIRGRDFREYGDYSFNTDREFFRRGLYETLGLDRHDVRIPLLVIGDGKVSKSETEEYSYRNLLMPYLTNTLTTVTGEERSMRRTLSAESVGVRNGIERYILETLGIDSPKEVTWDFIIRLEDVDNYQYDHDKLIAYVDEAVKCL